MSSKTMMPFCLSFGSVVLMALAGPLLKLALGELQGLQVLQVSSLSAFLCAVIWASGTKKLRRVQISRGLLVISSIYAAAMTAFILALKSEGPLFVSIGSRISLVLTFVCSIAYLKEKMTGLKLLGALFIIGGTLDAGIGLLSSSFLIVLYAGLFALHSTLLKKWSDIGTVEIVIAQNAMTFLFLTSLQRTLSIEFILHERAIALAALGGGVSSFLGFLLYRRGLEGLTLSSATAIRALSPLVSILVIYPFFPQSFSRIGLVPLSLVPFGSLVFNLKEYMCTLNLASKATILTQLKKTSS